MSQYNEIEVLLLTQAIIIIIMTSFVYNYVCNRVYEIKFRELSFFTGMGWDHLFVMAGRQFFLVPPLCLRGKILPPWPTGINGPPAFEHPKKIWSPHKQTAPSR